MTRDRDRKTPKVPFVTHNQPDAMAPVPRGGDLAASRDAPPGMHLQRVLHSEEEEQKLLSLQRGWGRRVAPSPGRQRTPSRPVPVPGALLSPLHRLCCKHGLKPECGPSCPCSQERVPVPGGAAPPSPASRAPAAPGCGGAADTNHPAPGTPKRTNQHKSSPLHQVRVFSLLT